jgi:hypothetical protein
MMWRTALNDLFWMSNFSSTAMVVGGFSES